MSNYACVFTVLEAVGTVPQGLDGLVKYVVHAGVALGVQVVVPVFVLPKVFVSPSVRIKLTVSTAAL